MNNVLFTNQNEYENWKRWVKEDLEGEVEWNDFVIEDNGYDSQTGNYYLWIDMDEFVKIFGWGEVENPEFDMIFS